MERQKFTLEFKLEVVSPDQGSRRIRGPCEGIARPWCAYVAVTQLVKNPGRESAKVRIRSVSWG